MSPALSHRCKKQNDVIQNMAEGLLNIAVLPHFSKNIDNCNDIDNDINNNFENDLNIGLHNDINSDQNNNDINDDNTSSGFNENIDDKNNNHNNHDKNESYSVVEGNIDFDNHDKRLRGNNKYYDGSYHNLDDNYKLSTFPLGMWEPLAGSSKLCGPWNQFQNKNCTNNQDNGVPQNSTNLIKSPDTQLINGIHHLNDAFTPQISTPQISSFPMSPEIDRTKNWEIEKGNNQVIILDGKISELDGTTNIDCNDSKKCIINAQNINECVVIKNIDNNNNCNKHLNDICHSKKFHYNNNTHTNTTIKTTHFINTVKQMEKNTEKINNRSKSGLIADKSFLLMGCSISKYAIKIIDKNCQKVTSVMIIQR